MSSEINTLSDLHRAILLQLMTGWQTMDQGKEAGFVRLSELSERFGLLAEEMRKELDLLELLGYIENVHSMGMDQSEQYKDIEQVTKREYDADDPTYFISENGKRRVVADTVSDDRSDTTVERV